MFLSLKRFAIICIFVVVSSHDSGSNWAVILTTSRYWFNYRHLSNALSIYRIVKQLGIKDSHIIFMNSLEVINSHRNPRRGEIFNRDELSIDSKNMLDDTEIDYHGNEVSVELFSRVLLNRLSDSVPAHKRLLTDNSSNILIYMSGHGGDEFFKFHDVEEMSAQDLGSVFFEMHVKQRYNSILLMLETCQAETMANYITAPNVIVLSSSKKGENSYAYTTNKEELGVSTIDRFTHSINEFFDKSLLSQRRPFSALTAAQKRAHCNQQQQLSLHSLFSTLHPSFLYSTPSIVQSNSLPENHHLYRDPRDVKLTEFFGDHSLLQQQCDSLSSTVKINATPNKKVLAAERDADIDIKTVKGSGSLSVEVDNVVEVEGQEEVAVTSDVSAQDAHFKELLEQEQSFMDALWEYHSSHSSLVQ